MGQSNVIAIIGPTASGKSDVAVALAELLAASDGSGGSGAEAVNADALQFYRGMDVGTAKITPAEMRGVPHHLLDVLDVTEPADVATFQRQARETFDAVTHRGRVPVLVGGSGLYVRAALDEMEFPGTDPEVRATWERELERLGTHALHAVLATRDPAAAQSILPSNGRRIVRALEVGELTGRPFAASLPRQRYARPAVQVGLAVPREQLDVRIDSRVARMREQGLTEEVRRLADHGLRDGLTASRALGYAQVLDALDGRTTEDEAYDLTARLTRRFARKQESWFRRDGRVRWIEAADGRTAGDLAAEVLAVLRSPPP